MYKALFFFLQNFQQSFCLKWSSMEKICLFWNCSIIRNYMVWSTLFSEEIKQTTLNPDLFRFIQHCFVIPLSSFTGITSLSQMKLHWKFSRTAFYKSWDLKVKPKLQSLLRPILCSEAEFKEFERQFKFKLRLKRLTLDF